MQAFVVQTKISLHQLQGVQWYYHMQWSQNTRSHTSLLRIFWVAQEEKRGSISGFEEQSASKDTDEQLDMRKRNCCLGCKKASAVFYTFLWKLDFLSITQVYVSAWESHTVSGELKGGSTPDRGNFYHLSSGTKWKQKQPEKLVPGVSTGITGSKDLHKPDQSHGRDCNSFKGFLLNQSKLKVKWLQEH